MTVPRINLSIRLGPMVHFEVQGENCTQVAEALQGFEQLNVLVEAMFSDLASRVYPDGEVPGTAEEAP
jgi:predicted RNase H-like nuclease (RuvC/YqgF family)